MLLVLLASKIKHSSENSIIIYFLYIQANLSFLKILISRCFFCFINSIYAVDSTQIPLPLLSLLCNKTIQSLSALFLISSLKFYTIKNLPGLFLPITKPPPLFKLPHLQNIKLGSSSLKALYPLILPEPKITSLIA